MLVDQTIGSTNAIKNETVSIVPDRSIDLDELCRISHSNPATMRQILTNFALQADILLALLAKRSPKSRCGSCPHFGGFSTRAGSLAGGGVCNGL